MLSKFGWKEEEEDGKSTIDRTKGTRSRKAIKIVTFNCCVTAKEISYEADVNTYVHLSIAYHKI